VIVPTVLCLIKFVVVLLPVCLTSLLFFSWNQSKKKLYTNMLHVDALFALRICCNIHLNSVISKC